MWLCHADAQQVSDLPKTTLKIWRSMTGSETLKERRVRCRRVRDLPRIGMAKPLGSLDFRSPTSSQKNIAISSYGSREQNL